MTARRTTPKAEIEAAKARNRKAYELAGEFAWLDFSDETQR